MATPFAVVFDSPSLMILYTSLLKCHVMIGWCGNVGEPVMHCIISSTYSGCIAS